MEWTIGIQLRLKLGQNGFPLHSVPGGPDPLCLGSVHAVLKTRINLAYRCVCMFLIPVL